MEASKKTIEVNENRASFSEDLGKSALKDAVDEAQKNNPETTSNDISVGSLVKLKLVEQDREVVIYISQYERNVDSLPANVQEQLPEKVMVNPLVVEKNNDDKKVADSLAERLEHRGVGDIIVLINQKHAEIIEITQLVS